MDTEYVVRIKRDDRNIERMRHPKKKVVPGYKKAKRNYRNGPDKRAIAFEESE